jgi:AcrR family transcriptional regulator
MTPSAAVPAEPISLEGEGRRERNRARTRRALEDAALRLFADRGFDGVTIEDIAAAADVSPRTFFRYFASKDDVIRLDPERLRLVVDGLAARPAGEAPLRALREAFDALGRAYELDRERVLLRNRAMRATPSLLGRALEIERAWQDGIARALARRDGARTPTRRHRTIAAAAMAMIRVSVERWLTSGGRSNLPALIAEQFSLLENVLSEPAARRSPQTRPPAGTGDRARVTKPQEIKPGGAR